MSLGAILLPLAISVLVTAADSKKEIRKKCTDPKAKNGVKAKPELILSRYSDASLLAKTLEEHGVSVEVVSDNCIKAVFAEGELTYLRNSADEPFSIDLKNVKCLDWHVYWIE